MRNEKLEEGTGGWLERWRGSSSGDKRIELKGDVETEKPREQNTKSLLKFITENVSDVQKLKTTTTTSRFGELQ